MTKQHFIAAAKQISTLLASGMPDARARAEGAAAIIVSLGLEFNPRFDVQRFMKACGLAA